MSNDETNIYNPDFVERNGAWMLSVLGIMGVATSAMLVYMLKSRCSYIKCCGVECERDVIDLESQPNLNLTTQPDAGVETRVTRHLRRYAMPTQSSNTEVTQK